MHPLFHRRAFTLIELLAVLVILIIVSTLLASPTASMMSGMALTEGGQMVRDQLGYARQAALSRNQPVEIRFYQYGDPEVPGESAENPANGKFRAMQLFEIKESGDAVPLEKIQRLPARTIMDSGNTLSSLLAKSNMTSGSTLNFSLPKVGTNYKCISFRFQPDGSANLSPTTELWFLTLHLLNVGDQLSSSHLPADFVTLQIEPSNGQVRIYRPGI